MDERAETEEGVRGAAKSDRIIEAKRREQQDNLISGIRSIYR